MGYERPYYEDLNYHPHLFYVVFGANAENLEVSRERHRVDVFPEGLNFVLYGKPTHTEYMESLLGGSMGKVLRDNSPQLYEVVCGTNNWAVIRGQIKNDSDLHYMRNAIGFVQALVEKGSIGVLDLFTLSLFTPSEWTEKIFEPEFEPQSHVMIFTSKMDDGTVWLHTRGMLKFGRPDISMEGVPHDMVENAARIINQIIFYGAQGVFLSQPTKLHTHNEITAVVKPAFIDDMENPDFNNSYYLINWDECEIRL